MDTIYSLSTGSLPSGVAVIRLSGTGCRDIARSMAGHIPAARSVALRPIRTRNGLPIDQGLVLFFPGPASFTGEDCLELHLHGGRAVVAKALAAIAEHPGLRQAEPGEFTKRAFENGKMDLVEIEGLGDLLAAETEMQRRLAVEQTRGGMSAMYDGWAERLTFARAMIEAELDFADEDDVPGSVAERVWTDMGALAHEIEQHLDGAGSAEIIRDGLKVVILGPPNAGKSSLLNRMARRDVAIVTEIAGTTRDVLHVDLDLRGYKVRLIDTAGIRETVDPVEREGIRRARQAAENADLILALTDLSEPMPEGYEPLQPSDIPVLRVGTKLDLTAVGGGKVDLRISTATGEGIDNLLEAITGFLPDVSEGQSLAFPMRLRHVTLLRDTLDCLSAALTGDLSLDLRAEQLRVAALSLGKITGSVDVEALLDVIFSQFCIGK